MNYRPELEDGLVDILKTLKISEALEISKRLRAYLIENNKIQTEIPFINDIDHMSFVWAQAN
jgi:malate dehydrogenase (quinone)